MDNDKMVAFCDAGDDGMEKCSDDTSMEMLRGLIELSKHQAITTSNLIQIHTELESRIKTLEDSNTKIVEDNERRKKEECLRPEQKDAIRERVTHRVYTLIGIRGKKLSNEEKRLRCVYAPLFYERLWEDVKATYKVSKYDYIPAYCYDEVMVLVDSWEPNNVDELKLEAEENWCNNHPGQSVDEYLGRLCL